VDLWQLIERDHENISQLIRDIPYGLNGPAVVRSRERMVDNLMDELEAHSEALDYSLYAHLRRHEQTAQLVKDLQREPATFMKQLGALAKHRRKGSQGWLNDFEDATLLVDQYLDRHTRALVPHAHALLSSGELEGAKRAFVRSKVKTLKARRGVLGRMRTEQAWLIATVGAIAACLGFLAWRKGGLRGSGLPYLGTPKGRQFSGVAARTVSGGRPRRHLNDNPFSAMFQRVSAEPTRPMGATGAGTLCTFGLKNRSLRRDVLPVLEEANRGWLKHGYQIYLKDKTLTESRDAEADRPALVFQIAGATLPRDLVSAQTFGFCFETNKGGDEASFTVRDPHSTGGAPWTGPQLDASDGCEPSVEQLRRILEYALRLALTKPV
jgi:hypothetical protein